MAVTQIIESDLSQASGATTRHIGLGNAWYEIDLTDDEYTQMCQVLDPYISHARPDSRLSAGARGGRGPGRSRSDRTGEVPITTPEQRDKIRSWAREQPEFAGTVKDAGRIRKEILVAYREAHPEMRFEWESSPSF
ncbi:Lsr2 dimerization domain-containing protein [Acidipropionibacterium jensenii]|uniref:Lsr2 n=1 Tax=Acidipropionibacterium jensenii TaxID=1749 RepID=A0A3S4UQJ7_9ACTN|nr:histone-like nucleoid-structuring protein Lsr2 [Acidipropionibacterium jensenii]MDN5976901.1 Lsr2 family protein [Acidipropionibacterium jensenii]MDN5995862.1 Lsr2 family protein [Acidipropionibacterium jensenii]MDN6021549.1 Lsr2 family protein [Acidipropionibacterium jensenii]MDN6426284.1 Lsr2 family protein [Acidipropionibacterium jensenii]MDN6441027.1 Lsr2 family protein [Acidipropionibacterium jensenii]